MLPVLQAIGTAPQVPWGVKLRTLTANQSRCAARFQPQGRGISLTDSLSAPACPQRKDLGHLPAFAIGPTAVEEIPKADCRTHKKSNARHQGR